MPVIVVGSPKGGCGKTTLATNLSIFLARKGKDCLLLDADPQRTSLEFIGRRNADHADLPAVHCTVGEGNIRHMVRDMSRRYEYVLVDVGGRNSREFRTALVTANTLIVPLRPSKFDTETLDTTVKLLGDAQEYNETLKAFALINQATTNPHTREVQAAKEYIEQFPEFEFISTVIHDRKAFRDAGAAGLSVLETANRTAAAEVELVAQHLFNLQ